MSKRKHTQKPSKNPSGKPPFFQTAEELQEKINQYFESGFRYKKVLVRRGKDYEVQEIPVITITGLVLFCGFADRSSFYQLEKQPKFSYTIKRARAFIEREYEEILNATGNVGAIFALKNFGWTDRVDVEHHDHKYLHIEFKSMTPEKLKDEAIAISGRIAGLIGTSRKD